MFVGKPQENKTGGLVTSVSSKSQNCSRNLLSHLSQLSGTGISLLQITHYNWLCLFVYVTVWKNPFLPHMTCLLRAACPCDRMFAQVTPLNPVCINCLML